MNFRIFQETLVHQKNIEIRANFHSNFAKVDTILVKIKKRIFRLNQKVFLDVVRQNLSNII